MKLDATRLVAGALTGMFIPRAERGASPTQVGQIAMVSGVLMTARDSGGPLAWSPIVDPRDLLYPFVSHTFTNAGATGRFGPSLAQCKTAYASASWAANADWFSTDNGIQVWTVPVTGYYRIRCRGGGRYRYTGLAATVTDTRPEADAVFRLQKGDRLRILVGQLGIMPIQVGTCPSGSGGSFVVSGEQGLLLVGGGAGGNGIAQNSVGVTTRLAGPARDGNTDIPPKAAEGMPGVRSYYSQGNVSSYGIGGSSYANRDDTTSTAPYPYTQGGAGGTQSDRGSHIGGFGGGGCGGVNYNTSYNATSVGGGGGYSGGDGYGKSGGGGKGGDGGCFIADFAEDQTFNMEAVNVARHGQVIVDLVG